MTYYSIQILEKIELQVKKRKRTKKEENKKEENEKEGNEKKRA